eukprot:CAMPEP_0203921054 /NCGR_PEP_ID=MMETSP0359-20131031/61258_1 /ASSEMBLY_ACC=CAM_ASM_000338 /TAXON_ID=268821 /ORGANISM="Scrippsiella Hangoei, Strain SHTV-5" /LENGTH=49 /DNA_ID= /DNA_START= /DNA_END= /DNA_ORIENTATION=
MYDMGANIAESIRTLQPTCRKAWSLGPERAVVAAAAEDKGGQASFMTPP